MKPCCQSPPACDVSVEVCCCLHIIRPLMDQRAGLGWHIAMDSDGSAIKSKWAARTFRSPLPDSVACLCVPIGRNRGEAIIKANDMHAVAACSIGGELAMATADTTCAAGIARRVFAPMTSSLRPPLAAGALEVT